MQSGPFAFTYLPANFGGDLQAAWKQSTVKHADPENQIKPQALGIHLSNVQNPCDISLYWLVRADPNNGLL